MDTTPESERRSRTATLAILLSGLLLATTVAGCATKSINHVLTDPGRYRDRNIQITGDVVDSFSVMSRGAYRVRDRTGQLWVVSDQGVPRTGARVKVRGTIREGFNLGSLAGRLPPGVGSGLVMVETSHSARR